VAAKVPSLRVLQAKAESTLASILHLGSRRVLSAISTFFQHSLKIAAVPLKGVQLAAFYDKHSRSMVLNSAYGQCLVSLPWQGAD
jgi:hypothetical protein